MAKTFAWRINSLTINFKPTAKKGMIAVLFNKETGVVERLQNVLLHEVETPNITNNTGEVHEFLSARFFGFGARSKINKPSLLFLEKASDLFVMLLIY